MANLLRMNRSPSRPLQRAQIHTAMNATYRNSPNLAKDLCNLVHLENTVKREKSKEKGHGGTLFFVVRLSFLITQFLFIQHQLDLLKVCL